MQVKLVWITPNAEALIAQIARVSNPSNQNNPDYTRLLQYLKRNNHWSPFEMASACLEIRTTRDIARQILRHRSFSFQEFSQRYAAVFDGPILRPARAQDSKNRQASTHIYDQTIQDDWSEEQQQVWNSASAAYQKALERGMAKEVARVLLPEGLTPSHLYMSGTIRSWLHYYELRCGNGTQLEHREIAIACGEVLRTYLPAVFDRKPPATLPEPPEWD